MWEDRSKNGQSFGSPLGLRAGRERGLTWDPTEMPRSEPWDPEVTGDRERKALENGQFPEVLEGSKNVSMSCL